jgi:adhesin/invasin
MTSLTRRAVSRGLAIAALAAVAACNGDQAPPPPVALVAVGDFQFTGTVAERLPSTLTVRVNDAQGSPVNGVPITFTVAEGGGSLTKLVDTTRSGGLATTNWTLGERAGTQRITASATGLTSIDFTATARAGAPSTIAANGGTGQSVVVGSAALTPPAVIVKDRFTNPVPGVSVVFTVASGGGTIVGNAATTNSAGIAAVTSWTMGTTVGANTLTALALSGGITGNPVTFSATATPGAVATIVAVGSTSLTSTVFTAVTPVPQVKVTDASGNAVPNVTVTFTTSGGTVVAGTTSATSVTRTTNASGIASPDGWVLGTAAGSYTLTASATGATSAVFTAAARAGAPATMTKVGGDAQSALAGRTVETEPSVRVVDIHGNPVAGVDVLFEVATGGGTAVGRRTITNALGIATVGGWTLGDAVGSNTLVASVPSSSVTAATFTATGTAGAASTMVGNGGQNQTAAAGTAVTTAPSVVVRDARGNPVAGVAVTFSVGSGGGTVVGGTATTNASGIATVTSWTLGGSVGTQTLIASSGTLPQVTFTATATAGAAARLIGFSSQSQSGIVAGAALTVSQRPAVRVTDAEGNPVSGASVTFRVAQDYSSGRLTGSDTIATASTNANGIASVGAWTMPATSGTTATAIASISGVAETVTFTVTTTFGAVSQLRITAGGLNTLSTTAGAAASTITITALDANNNTVTSYAGAKNLAFSGATAAPNTTAPTVDGVNFGTATSITFTNGVATGAMRLYKAETATISLTDGTFTSGVGVLTATVAAGAASATTTTLAIGTNAPARQATSIVTVTVNDVYGNLRTSAANTEFTAGVVLGTAAAGTLSAFTCTSGVCTATYTAPNAAGTNTLSATIGVTPIVNSSITITMP